MSRRVTIISTTDHFEVTLAQSSAELRAAQQLRYRVFVQEMGAKGPTVDHSNALEQDRFDPFCDHLLLKDLDKNAVVGVYRVMRQDQAAQAGGHYSETEFDLHALRTSGKRLLELGRSCIHPAYRGGMALHTLWGGLARYIEQYKIEVLFGAGSFPGTDQAALAQPLSLLHHRHLAPDHYRVHAIGPTAAMTDILPEHTLDRATAMVQVPSLIKSYLRLGGWIGQGAYVDHDFNTTDVCLIIDTEQLNTRQARRYSAGDRR